MLRFSIRFTFQTNLGGPNHDLENFPNVSGALDLLFRCTTTLTTNLWRSFTRLTFYIVLGVPNRDLENLRNDTGAREALVVGFAAHVVFQTNFEGPNHDLENRPNVPGDTFDISE